MRIEQYFLMTDYSLLEVILNGDSPAPTRVVEGVLQPIAPTIVEQKLARKNELKACGTLLMALPDKHQLKFNSHKDAKALIPQLDNEDLKQIDTDDLEEMNLKWQMAMLTMRARRFLQRIRRNLRANGPTSMGFDMSKVECYNCHKKGHFERECRSPKDSRRNGAAEPKRRNAPARLLVYKQNESVFEEDIKLLKLEVQLSDNALVTLRQKLEKAEQEMDDLKLKLEKFQTSSKNLTELLASQTNEKTGLGYNYQSTEQVKSPRHYVQHVETFILAASPKPASPKPTSNGKRKNRKACFVCKSLDHLIKYCDYHAKKMAQPTARNHTYMGNHQQYAPMIPQNPQRHMVPAAVVTQSKPVHFTTVRPVSTAVPKIKVTRLRHVTPIITKTHLPIRRHITRSPSPKASNSPPKVTAIKASVVNAA
nr:ribonuclease H-like domain-containing protein [Tanacetum cinerariifolium]